MNQPMTPQEKQAAYDAWYIAEVDKGIADCDANNVMTEEEAEAGMAVFMAKLHKKYDQKAA
jgi:hypothetical protein